MFSRHKKLTKRKKHLKEWVIKSNIVKARFRGTGIKRYSQNLRFFDKTKHTNDQINTKILTERVLNGSRKKIL
jgi:hypothetical protein